MQVRSDNSRKSEINVKNTLNVIDSHREAPFLYTVNITGSGILELKQAQHSGWVIIGDVENFSAEKVTVNNWSNGWIIDNQNDQPVEIQVVYWPQVLQFIGFVLVIFGFYSLFWFKLVEKDKNE
jgi:hypothetical protein